MVKFAQSYEIVRNVFAEKIASFAYFGQPTPPPRPQHFWETFLQLGQISRKSWSKYDDTPPPPPPPSMLMPSRRP
jgi:hypothetical protein